MHVPLKKHTRILTQKKFLLHWELIFMIFIVISNGNIVHDQIFKKYFKKFNTYIKYMQKLLSSRYIWRVESVAF